VYKSLQGPPPEAKVATIARPSVVYYFVLGAVSTAFIALLLTRGLHD
jgi:hypothetical protein